MAPGISRDLLSLLFLVFPARKKVPRGTYPFSSNPPITYARAAAQQQSSHHIWLAAPQQHYARSEADQAGSIRTRNMPRAVCTSTYTAVL